MKRLWLILVIIILAMPALAQDDDDFDFEPPYTDDEILAMEEIGLEYTDHEPMADLPLRAAATDFAAPLAAPTATLFYWADQSSDRLGSVQSDGTNLITLVSMADDGVGDNSRGLAFDPVGDANGPKVYFTTGSNPIGLYRMDPDGSNIEVLIDQTVLSSPWAIDIDFDNDLIYLTDITDDRIYVADLYGTPAAIQASLQTFYSGTEAGFVEDIELDIANNTIYWSDFNAEEIYSAPLGLSLPISAGDITTVCDFSVSPAVSNVRYFERDIVNDTIFVTSGLGLARTDDINCTGNAATSVIPSVSGRGILLDTANGVGYVTESTNDSLWQFDLTNTVAPFVVLADPAPGDVWETPQELIYGGLADTAPTVALTSPANSAVDVAVNATINVTFDEPVDLTAGAFTLECPAGSAVSFSVSPAGTSDAFTVTPDADLPYETTCTLTVVAANVTDSDTVDGPDALASDVTISFATVAEPVVVVNPPAPEPAPTTVAPQQPEDLGITQLPSTGEVPFWIARISAILDLLD